ncbi:MAG: TetR/AcrR family transcriptional regulator [Anaerolineae bacterium]|nr:TetR/AcrR family transcriptional regulator [Anaerolineae bacterium]
MPRPRFEKLPPEKRELILETAAKEFAEFGYEGASLNQILAKAGISKGAAYYYFDNKEDLYGTAVSHYAIEMIDKLDLDFQDLTAVSFWPALQTMYEQQYTQFAERPWVFGVVKSGGPMNQALLMQGELGEFWQNLEGMLANLLRQGAELGVVRHDLPDDLMMAVVMAVDEAHDNWLLSHLPEMTNEELQAAAAQMVGLLQKLLAP